MQTFRMPELWEFVYMFLLAVSMVGIALWMANLQFRKKIEEPWATCVLFAVTGVVFIGGLVLYEMLKTNGLGC